MQGLLWGRWNCVTTAGTEGCRKVLAVTSVIVSVHKECMNGPGLCSGLLWQLIFACCLLIDLRGVRGNGRYHPGQHLQGGKAWLLLRFRSMKLLLSCVFVLWSS